MVRGPLHGFNQVIIPLCFTSVFKLQQIMQQEVFLQLSNSLKAALSFAADFCHAVEATWTNLLERYIWNSFPLCFHPWDLSSPHTAMPAVDSTLPQRPSCPGDSQPVLRLVVCPQGLMGLSSPSLCWRQQSCQGGGEEKLMPYCSSVTCFNRSVMGSACFQQSI